MNLLVGYTFMTFTLYFSMSTRFVELAQLLIIVLLYVYEMEELL